MGDDDAAIGKFAAVEGDDAFTVGIRHHRAKLAAHAQPRGAHWGGNCIDVSFGVLRQYGPHSGGRTASSLASKVRSLLNVQDVGGVSLSLYGANRYGRKDPDEFSTRG